MREDRFPNEADLEIMLSVELDERLEDVAPGKTHIHRVFNLVTWAEAHGRVSELLVAAREQKPTSQELRVLAEALEAEPTAEYERPRASRAGFELASVSNFDLHQPVLSAHRATFGKNGLVGLAVHSDDDELLGHLCERLREKLAVRQLQVRHATLKPTVASVSDAVRNVKSFANLLKVSDVVCRVRLDVYDLTSAVEIAAAFWEALTRELGSLPPNRLIVILALPHQEACPAGMCRLPTPMFSRDDVWDWVSSVTSALPWDHCDQAELALAWEQSILDHCTANETLITHRVYDNLKWIGLGLQRQTASTPSGFRQWLADWS